MRILLDMDGVCADFVTGVEELLGEVDDKAKESYAIHEWYDMSASEFWDAIDEGKVAFWSHLMPYPYYRDLYQALEESHEVYFSTSPSLSPWSAAGKIKWLQDRHGKYFKNYMIGSHKHLMANNDTILIDDSSDKCKAFDMHGGWTILYPRPWNEFKERYKMRHEKEIVRDVINRVEEISNHVNSRRP